MDQMKFGLAEKIRETTVSRRGFLLTSLAGGFAVASEPVFAQAIKTDTQGITAGEVKVPVKDGQIPAYRAMPAKGGNFPVILVIQEIFWGARVHSGHLPSIGQAGLLRNCACHVQP